MSKRVTIMKTNKNRQSSVRGPVSEENSNDESSPIQDGEGAHASYGQQQVVSSTALNTVLEEIRGFRKENKQQLDEIKTELTAVNLKVTEAETRIGKVEDRVQNMEKVVGDMLRVMTQQEVKMLDQEGRSRRDNLRVYNVPEGAEGKSALPSDMVKFMDKMLHDTLDIPQTVTLGIQRAHRALAPPPVAGRAVKKPRSIVINFLSYNTKEDVLRKAWGKRKVLLNECQIFFDHDYPLVVLQKRKEYNEAKRVLKQNNIRFQTPYPARMRVFYEDGPRLYESAKEATTDMNNRGMSITIVSPKESATEKLSRTAWELVGRVHRREEEGERRSAKDKLQVFRRHSPAAREGRPGD